ncbi:EKC/KEOPS complex subunit bud32 [Condylostylus longicornis]|uniref:EKC/KEOPS complex subunit bud32 n=1 Tax=Condylostylus longicornis TaxID=2530218 RepID=UPI00244E2818|nr:EKC/KEOPS complex subunit bud32 [Condylostylus longicornis]
MLLSQGAEAKIYVGDYKGKQCLIKERFIKKYRHPDLDKQITKERMRAESKAIKRCTESGILTPEIFYVDFEDRKIFMQYFSGSLTSKQYINEYLSNGLSESEEKLYKLCVGIGELIGKLHKNNIIHGDLTTSNFLVNPKSKDNFDEYELIVIDFGLSYYSQSAEDKAVDIYVLERALLSTHSNSPQMFNQVLDAYETVDEKSCREVITKFEEVRARGRKRTMIG